MTRHAVVRPTGLAYVRVADLTYDGLVALVGYPVEQIVLAGGRGLLLVSEAGDGRRLARNDVATGLARDAIGPDEAIIGTAVVTGPPDAFGAWTDIHPDVEAELLAALAQRGRRDDDDVNPLHTSEAKGYGRPDSPAEPGEG